MESNVIKYRQIADILRERISRGIYRTGDKLPPYPRLCELFGVSDTTIRQAVALLAHEQLLRRERGRGKGVFVNPPVAAGRKPALRRLCILPAAASQRSDDPAIQQGVLQEVDAGEAGLVLMPALSGSARIDYLKRLVDNSAVDGFLINGQIFRSGDEAAEVVEYLDEKKLRYLLLFSAEDDTSRKFLSSGHPGIYIDEHSALSRAIELAVRKGRKRLLFAGVDRYSVERSREVARRTPAGAAIALEALLFDELSVRTLFREFERQLLPELDERTTLVLEGSNLPLCYFDALLSSRNLRPGKEISMFFFEHYCDLDPLFRARCSSVTRPYAELGRAAGRLLQKMVCEGARGEVVTVKAEFNDLGTI